MDYQVNYWNRRCFWGMAMGRILGVIWLWGISASRSSPLVALQILISSKTCS